MIQRILPLTVTERLHSLAVQLLCMMVLIVPSVGFADQSIQTELDVSPKRCVTLRQGQPCFVRIKFEWAANEDIQACLFNADGVKIACWQSVKTGTIVTSQTLPASTDYLLVDADGTELNRATVSVSWVYRKKRSKRRWRLF